MSKVIYLRSDRVNTECKVSEYIFGTLLNGPDSYELPIHVLYFVERAGSSDISDIRLLKVGYGDEIIDVNQDIDEIHIAFGGSYFDYDMASEAFEIYSKNYVFEEVDNE